jgi:hypothetical protein
MRTHAPSPESNFKVSNLMPDDARYLLLSMASYGNGHSNETEVATAIVKVKYQHSDAVEHYRSNN